MGEVSSWDLEISDDGGSTWAPVASTITDPTYTVTGLDSSTTYQLRASARIVTESTVIVSATTAAAPPIPSIYAAGTGMETAFSAASNPFDAGGDARVFCWQIENTSGRTADSIIVLLPNATTTPGSATVAVGVGGSGYDAATYSTPSGPVAIPVSGGSGELELGMALVELDLPTPALPGDRVVLRLELGEGSSWTGIGSCTSTADSDGYPEGPQMGVLGQGLVDSWSSSGSNIGIGLGGVQWRTTGSPIVRILEVGDSVSVGVPPLADGSPDTRISWVSGINTTEAPNGQRFCLSGYGEGGYTADNFESRIRHLIDNSPATLQAICEIVAFQYPTWNQYPASGSDSDAREAQFLGLKADLAELGIACIPFCLTPPGLERQSAGHLTAYTRARAFIAAQGGVDASSFVAASGDVTNLDSSKSADNVHLNSSYGPTHGVLSHPLWAAALEGLGLIEAVA